MYGSPASKDLNLPIQASPAMSSAGLLRYRSAPSTLLGEVCEDFLPPPAPARAASPGSAAAAAETVFAHFLGCHDDDGHHHHHQIRDKPPPPPHPGAASHFATSAAMEEAAAAAAQQQQQLMYHSQQQQQMAAAAHGAVEGLYRTVSSTAGMEAEQMKASAAAAGGGSLIRQSSSPAGLFNHLHMDNGFGSMLRAGMGGGGFRNGGNAAADVSAAAAAAGGGGGVGRLKGQLSFSSRQGSLMSQISESEELGGGSSPEVGGGSCGGRGYVPGGYTMSSGWEETSLLSDGLPGMKRPRDPSEPAQNGLTHQFSLPKTSSEIAAIEKFLQFQDAVPCKIRAKRGCATHPRSIAERVRRTRISERIRKLQELVPNMDKQTNTADMLDLAVDYIKDLQKQVKVLNDGRANCTCSVSKQKQYSS